MRGYEVARAIEYNMPVTDYDGSSFKPAYKDTRLPEHQTKHSACADFFCAEEVVIPSIWKAVFSVLTHDLKLKLFPIKSNIVNDEEEVKETNKQFNPTIVHTGVKACMNDDEVLEIFSRSSNAKKLGLILSNSVGIIDADYYNNTDNDGEIMFGFYNIKPWDVTIHVGDRVGQGMFKKLLRPEIGYFVKDEVRTGGIGSTGNK